MRRLNFVSAKTGSIIPWRFSVEPAAVVGVEHAAHEGVGAAIPARPGALAFQGVGWDQHLDPAANDGLHLRLVPVAGIRDHHARPLGDAGALELLLGGADHRLEVPEVR